MFEHNDDDDLAERTISTFAERNGISRPDARAFLCIVNAWSFRQELRDIRGETKASINRRVGDDAD